MNLRLVTALLAVSLAALAPLMAQEKVRYEKPDGATLRDLARKAGVHFGGNFPGLVDGKGRNNWEQSATIDAEKAIAADQFTTMTCGWQVFPGHSWKGDGEHDFKGVDAYIEWCRENDVAFHGHGLGYAHRVGWFQKLPGETPEQLAEVRRIYERGLRDTASHFRGKVLVWDVCNEQLNVPYRSRGFLGDQHYRRAYRTDPADPATETAYFIESFKIVHAADPDAKLILLDFNNEIVCPKSDFMAQVVKDMLAAEAPIDGVGFQMHLSTDLRRTKGQPIADDDEYFESISRNFARFAELGMDLWITELEVQIDPEKDREAELLRQAEVYRRVCATALACPRMRGIKMWGVLDRRVWGNVPEGRPYLFDENGRAKPAFFAVREVLAERAAAAAAAR